MLCNRAELQLCWAGPSSGLLLSCNPGQNNSDIVLGQILDFSFFSSQLWLSTGWYQPLHCAYCCFSPGFCVCVCVCIRQLYFILTALLRHGAATPPHPTFAVGSLLHNKSPPFRDYTVQDVVDSKQRAFSLSLTRPCLFSAQRLWWMRATWAPLIGSHGSTWTLKKSMGRVSGWGEGLDVCASGNAVRRNMRRKWKKEPRIAADNVDQRDVNVRLVSASLKPDNYYSGVFL